MGLPTRYRKNRERALASYDFVDIANGTGLEIYYGGMGISTYLLSTNTFYSETVVTRSSTHGTDQYVKVLDIDFDFPVGLPIILKGNVIVNATVGIYVIGTNTQRNTYIVATVENYDPIRASGTTVVTATSATWSQPNATAGQRYSHTFCVNGSISTATVIPAGNYVRLTIEVWGQNAAAGDCKWALAHDPKDRNDPGDSSAAYKCINDDDTTVLYLHLPYRIDL